MFKTKIIKSIMAMFTVMSLAGCMTIQPIDPIKNPPLQYRNDTIVPVEFVNPMEVGFRCAERGAKFLNMPGVNSKACASPDLVTVPNPCMTITGGWYAELLCHELAHANGWSPTHEGGNWMPDRMVHGSATPQYIADASPAEDETLKTVEIAEAPGIEAVQTEDGMGVQVSINGSQVTLDADTAAAIEGLLEGWKSNSTVHEDLHTPKNTFGLQKIALRKQSAEVQEFAPAVEGVAAESEEKIVEELTEDALTASVAPDEVELVAENGADADVAEVSDREQLASSDGVDTAAAVGGFRMMRDYAAKFFWR